MYVRTKKRTLQPPQIARIRNMSKDSGYKNQCYIELDKNLIPSYKYHIYGEDVLKASHNIIDLIQEKDLLEIEYFSLRYNERVTRLFEVTFRDERYINLSNAKCEFMLINGEFNKDDKELEPIIKSIVTKEQFESMAYKVV